MSALINKLFSFNWDGGARIFLLATWLLITTREQFFLKIHILPHIKNMTKHDPFVNFKVCLLVLFCKFGIVFSELFAMPFLSIYLVELRTETSCMHHALLLASVLGVCGNVDDYGVMLWEASLEISLLPFELLIFRKKRRMSHHEWPIVLFLSAAREAEKLQMHPFNKIKVAI